MIDSPFKVFLNWLFDSNIDSEIPYKQELLKYNSPITETYLISMFRKCLKLNYYLDTYLNSINLRYLEKEELFKFIKKCVIDFKITRYQVWSSWPKKESNLYKNLQLKIPIIKNDEIDILCNIIENLTDENLKDSIFASLKLSKPIKKKLKRETKNQIKNEKVSLENFIQDTFSIVILKD